MTVLTIAVVVQIIPLVSNTQGDLVIKNNKASKNL